MTKPESEAERLQLQSEHYVIGFGALDNWGDWQESLPAAGPVRDAKLSSIYQWYQPKYRDLPKSRTAVTDIDHAMLVDQVVCVVINNRALIDMLVGYYAKSDTRENIVQSHKWWQHKHKSNLSETKYREHLNRQTERVGEHVEYIEQGVLDIELLSILFKLKTS